MIINRNNYEEFFLLYVDDELKPEERTEVEKFAGLHPDLQEELSMLKQATIFAEPIHFAGKQDLYKQENSISLANYEEYFLLSVDNELDKKQADDVEQFVLKHPQLQEEFTVIKKAKLEPELIEYKEKKKLFRKEKLVIPIGLMRMSIAAAVATIIALTWLLNKNDQVKHEDTFVTINKPAEKIPVKKDPIIIDKSVTEKPLVSLINKSQVKKVESKVPEPVITSAGNKDQLYAKVATKPVFKAIKKEQSILSSPEIISQDVAKTRLPEDVADDITSEKIDLGETFKPNNDAVDARYTNEETPLVKHAVYREIDNDEEDKSVYIGSTQINKNKLKGLFKKAATLFDKKADQDEDDKTLRIAGFRIKSK